MKVSRCCAADGAEKVNLPCGHLRDCQYLSKRECEQYKPLTVPARNDRVVHDGLVGLLLEVTIPAGPEFWARPAVHAVKFLLGGTNLDTSIDAVGGKWAGAVDVPLLKHLLLHGCVSTHKVVKGLDVRLGPIGRKGEVVVLEVQADTG